MKTWSAFFLMLTWAAIMGTVHWLLPVLYVAATFAITALRLKLSQDYRDSWQVRGWPLPGVLK